MRKRFALLCVPQQHAAAKRSLLRSIDRKRDARASCVLFILKERKAFAAAEPRKTHEKTISGSGKDRGYARRTRTLYFDGGKTDAGLLSSRVHKSLLLVRLKGVESATQADLYRGKILYLDRNDVRLPKNRYFVEDLIGLHVIDDATGAEYGTVQDVFETGANNVYRIVNGAGEEFLFPAVDAMIAKTDIESGKLFVKPIPGIFGDGAETVPVNAGEAADAD